MSDDKFVDGGDVELTPDQSYRFGRLAAVACGAAGPENCRHAWNAAHPDDQVTEAEQRAFEDSFDVALRTHEHGDLNDRR